MVTTVFLLVCVLILVSSCNVPNGTSSSNVGGIIENLQKEVPFTIVIPAYLPVGISPYPTGILGPGKGRFSDSSIMVGFGYSKKGSNTEGIDIYEENYEVTFIPSYPSSVYLNIRGVQVLEEESELVLPSESPSENKILNGYFYGWNRNGINFELTIYGYEIDEGRKVVESMINP